MADSETFQIDLKPGHSFWITLNNWQVAFLWGEYVRHLSLGWLSFVWLRFDGEHLLDVWPMFVDERGSMWEMLLDARDRCGDTYKTCGPEESCKKVNSKDGPKWVCEG